LFILDEKSRRTLTILALLWLVFFACCFGLALYLSHKVSVVESMAYPALAQPHYSEDEDKVAFLSKPPEGGPWQLWTVSGLNETSRLLCTLDPGEWTLLGWFDGDRRILLQPARQDVPNVLMVEVSSGHQKEFRFAGKSTRLVGVKGGQLFFQRYGRGDVENPDELSSSLTLLTWSPGDEALSEVVTIPYETEKLTLEQVWPSLNQRWFALVILMGESGRDRTLWTYDREEDRLEWTGIRLECDAIRAAWSPDSSGLVAAIETADGCDLYAFWNIHSGTYTRLSSGNTRHAYQPFWPRGENSFLLVEKNRVFHFNPETLQATPLEAEDWNVLGSRELSVSPRGTYATYVGSEDDADQLYRVNFKSKQTQRLLPPHGKSLYQREWWFILGQGFRSMLGGS